jgi:hypothetical protein
VFGVAAASALGHANEAQRLGLADGWRDAVVVDSIFDELSLGNRQLPVVVTAVVRKLDGNPIYRHARRPREHAIGWRFQHRNRIRSPLLASLVAPLYGHGTISTARTIAALRCFLVMVLTSAGSVGGKARIASRCVEYLPIKVPESVKAKKLPSSGTMGPGEVRAVIGANVAGAQRTGDVLAAG